MIRRPRSILLVLLLVLSAACAGAADTVDDTADEPSQGDATAGDDTADDGDSPDDDADDDAEDPSDEDSAAAAAGPVTIEHTYGETVIEDVPERVVSVGLRDHDALLALDVIPVAVREWFGEQPSATWPWAQDELADAEPVVLDPNELDVEVILALEPDLIVGVDSALSQEEYDLLSEVAPTIAQPAEHPDFAVPWRERTRIVARAVGQEDRGEELIAEVEDAFAEATEQYPEFAGSTALVGLAAADGQAYAYGSADVRSRFLTELGFTIPDTIEDQVAEEDFFVTLSPERFGDLDSDVLLWVGGDAAAFDGVTSVPTYPQTVVDEGRDLFLPYDPYGGAISYSTVLSLPFLIEEFVPELATALDGDPDTTSELGR